MLGNAIFYWVIRAHVASMGVIVVFGIYFCLFLMPERARNEDSQPSLVQNCVSLVVAFTVVAITLIPNRLTLRKWLFWPRMATCIVVGLCFLYLGVFLCFETAIEGQNLIAGYIGYWVIVVGVGAPGCLWNRATRKERRDYEDGNFP